jgi:hypothetical protein
VHLPKALTDYKEFLRGQNHYDPYLLSGVSGHGARSFYYPPQAETNCAGCHMPLNPSADFGAKLFAGAKELSIHNHLFPTANTGVAWLRDKPDVIAAHQEFLKGALRVDLFGIRPGRAAKSIVRSSRRCARKCQRSNRARIISWKPSFARLNWATCSPRARPTPTKSGSTSRSHLADA